MKQVSTNPVSPNLNRMSTQGLQIKNRFSNQIQGDVRSHQVDLHNMISPLDKQREFTQDNLEKFTSAKENMQKYMDCYSQTFNLPSLYVQNQLFYKPKPNFIIQVVQYVYPEKSEGVQVFQHMLDGRSEMRNFDDIYNSNYGAYLKLLKVAHGEFHTIQEVQISKTAKQIDIAFSEDYQHLAVSFVEGDKTHIRVISCEQKDDIKTIMNNFNAKNYQLSIDLDTNYIRHLIFDRNDKYLIGYGDTKVLVLDLYGNESKKEFEIPTDYFEKIYHLRFESFENSPYVCFVACKKQGIRQICLFNINQENVFDKIHHDCVSSDEEQDQQCQESKSKSQILSREEEINKEIQILTFFHERSEHLKIMISQDCNKVVFCNANENFMMEKKYGVTLQKNLPQLRNKIVRFISSSEDGSEFYFVACHDYDTCLEIQSTSDTNFELIIPRSVEPGIIKIFDMMIKYEEVNDDNLQSSWIVNNIQLLSLKDDDTVYDKMKYVLKAADVDPRASLVNKMNVESTQKISIIQQNMKAYSFEWPYVCFSGLMNNYLFVLNVFDNKIIHRIQLKDDNSSIEGGHFKVLATCITTTNDLYVLTQELKYFRVFHLDLDESNQLEHTRSINHMFKQDQVLEYTEDDVDGLKFQNFHCRGSSIKEKIDTNHKLQIFVRHGDKLFSCVQLDSNKEALQINPKLKFISYISSWLYFLSDSKFMFLETIRGQQGRVIEQNIKQVDVFFRYSTCEIILKESSVKEEIISFNIDQGALRLFLLTESWNENLNKFDSKVFKIYSLEKKSVFFETKITHEPLIQRLKSGLYTLVDGHIYFNNNVIKIRYDLMEHKDSHILVENEVFDYYTDIFQLNPGERVKSGTPLDSIRSHKMAYVTSDKENFSTSKVKYTPYLHEKKLFLNRFKLNTDYFQTSVNTKLLDETTSSAFQLVTTIVMNLTERKMYSYTQNGIMVSRYVFKREANSYGEPIKTSSNGQNFIFKRSKEQMKEQNTKKKDKWTYNVMAISMFGVRFIKQINIKDKYEILNKNGSTWLDDFFEDTETMPYFEFQINDNLDTIVKITNSHKKEAQSTVIFLFIANNDQFHPENLKKVIKPQEKEFFRLKFEKLTARKSFLYLHDLQNEEWARNEVMNPNLDTHDCCKKDLDNYNFALNNRYFIIYNKKTIHYYQLTEENQTFDPSKLENVNLEIGEEEHYSKIKGIYCGSNSNEVIILVNSTIETDLMIEWDMMNNTETNSYDVGKEYQVYFDACGETLVATKHHCLMNGTIMKAFKVDNNMYSASIQTHNLGLYQGHRFDHNNHNWLITQKYMALPFSYMSFVIKNSIENNDKRSKIELFDIEPYNYIFNRSSSFLDSQFVTDNHIILEKVLSNCMRIEPDIIDALSYVQAYKNEEDSVYVDQKKYYPNLCIAPLSKAVKKDNNRCVALLLQYMSNIDHDISTLIQDLFPKLIDQVTFQDFLAKMSVQTSQMRDKQFITVEHPYNRDYVRMSVSQSLYVDGTWFSKNMGEERISGNKNYPVEIKAMKIRWFILSQYGNEFLSEILNNENLDLYNIPTLRIIIEFFYSQYKRYLFVKDIPIFCFKIGIFFLTLFLNERLLTQTILDNKVSIKTHYYVIEFLLVMQIFVQCVQIYIYYQSWKHAKWVFFKNFQNYAGMIMVILFFLYCFFVHVSLGFVDSHNHQRTDFIHYITGERYIEVILVFFLTQRFFNFLELYDETSPLMDIIFKIFSDIKWFVMVFLVVIFGISVCFYLIGQLQMDFDGLTADEKGQISYSTFAESIWYVWFLVLGQPDTSMFALGDGKQDWMLRALFTFAAFFLIIHMLNMLIAIMGNTFAVRSEIASQTRMRDHLKFVISNWHLSNYAFENKASLKYIITAFAQDGTKEAEDIHEIVHEQSSTLLSAIRESSLNAQMKQNELELKVLSLTHAVAKLTNMVQIQTQDINGEVDDNLHTHDAIEQRDQNLADSHEKSLQMSKMQSQSYRESRGNVVSSTRKQE